MYAVLVKNNGSYDVIGEWSNNQPEKRAAVEAAVESGLPIVGMEANAYKLEAKYGATWNGSTFSGGTAGPNLLSSTQEQLDSFNLYVFLCDNVVVARLATSVNSAKAEMYAAAFTNEVILVKVPSDQKVFPGETYNWDGSRFSAVA